MGAVCARLAIAALLLCVALAGAVHAQDGRDGLVQQLAAPLSPIPVSPTAAAIARENELPFLAGPPDILRFDGQSGSALILANGRVEVGNSGDDTSITHLDPGLFRLRREGSDWRLEEAVPLGRNRIVSHRMQVDLRPLRGLSVTDVMRIEVVGDDGFALGLNRRAEIREVRLGDATPASVFRNGLLWIDAPPGTQTLSLSYDLTVEREAGANSGVFLDDHGHLRSQYWWHPHLGLTEERSRAAFDVTLTAPAELFVALDYPSSEVVDAVRTVRMTAPEEVIALSLAYDAGWTPRRLTVGDYTLHLFAAPDFTPGDVVLQEGFAAATGALSARFGVPSQRAVSVVQNRARSRPAWAFLSNSAIHAGPAGVDFDQLSEFPVHAPFGHEVAHLWTRSGGELQYLLTEGWATYAEAVILEAAHGPAAADRFWRDRAELVALQPELLDTPLNRDVSNGGVSYHKGAWVFAMLERVLGQRAFDAGIARYARAPVGQRDYAGFLAAFGDWEPVARRFLEPWVSEPGLPELSLVREGDALVLVQSGPLYWLPDFEILMEPEDAEPVAVRVDVSVRRTQLPVQRWTGGKITLDPHSRYLMVGERQTVVE